MIVFEEVSKVFPGGLRAVDRLSLEVSEGETLVLLGTSGSGKTTTMKMVNRLIEPTEGRILVGGEDAALQDVSSLRRRIGYAIQHIGLFPHMTVGENIAVVPRLLGWDDGRVKERTEKLLAMVGLPPEDFGDRWPAQLSGGQRQRVGVARALAADPPIVLMDEPFGALDPITRETLQNEFLELESEMKKTILFVTHDVFEAVKMGDRIAVMDEGRIAQLATPAEIVERPANEFVEQFLGRHRFQLALLTRTIGALPAECLEKGPELLKRPADALGWMSSLVDALDAFKGGGRDRLPVYRQGSLAGWLLKERLISEIGHALGTAGEVSA